MDAAATDRQTQWSAEVLAPAADDRRSHSRFPLHLPLQYWFAEGRTVVPGHGRTVNISSSGILFRSDAGLAAGREIEISIEWPAPLDDAVGLRLRITGRTVRRQDDCTAVILGRYEFRTRRIRDNVHAA